SDLEEHHPGIDSLDLPKVVATGGKMRLRPTPTTPWPMLTAVRPPSLTMAHWPTPTAIWPAWAAPCPVRSTNTRGTPRTRKRVEARLQQKIRSLAPRLPEILRSTDEQLAFQSGLLAAAVATPAGESFAFQGQRYEHLLLNSLRERGGTYRGTGRIWLKDLA